MKLSTDFIAKVTEYTFDTCAALNHKKAARSTAPTVGNGPDLRTLTGGPQWL